MPKLSARSERNLASVHPDLVRVFRKVAETEPIEVLCGHRPKEEQDRVYREGRSRVRWPNSRHNSLPAEAVDIVPIPINWADLKPFLRLGVIIKAVAAELGVPIFWGGDFKTLRDYPHWELR